MPSDIKILVVDDDAEKRFLIAHHLAREFKEAELIQCESGAAAIAHLEKHSVNAVVTDNSMSPVNGIELIRWLRERNRHLPVALAVTQSTFFYENSDLEASIDLDRVREVEYDIELATGLAIASGRVLRLRSDSQTFEFVLPADAVAPWQTMLPARGAIDAQPEVKAAASVELP